MDNNGLLLIAMFGCLIMEGFYAGSEIAVVSTDRLKLRHMAAKGSRGAQIALEMLQKPEILLSTTLVGINVAIVTNSSLATILAMNLFGTEYAWMAIILVAPFIWVFGEIVPKSIFQQQADVITPKIIYVLKGSFYLFYPIIATFTFASGLIARMLGGEATKSHFTLREELDLILQMPASGDVRTEEKHMIRRLFNFNETRVRDIMVPLIDVSTVDIRFTCGQVFQTADRSSHVRILVHSNRVDQVVGMINAFELLGLPDDTPIKPHIKPIRFVPGSKNLVDLLNEFRAKGERIAAVVDEYGSTQGIITLEDIMERVVGSLQDEYDDDERAPQEKIKVVDATTTIVPARIRLVTLKDELSISLPEGNYETLAGFLLERWQRIPEKGEAIEANNYRFVVEKSHKKAVLQVRIVRLG